MPDITFDQALGLVIDELTADRCTGHVDVTDGLKQPYGIVHGGVYCSIVETLGSVAGAAWAAGNGFFGAVGVHNSTDFIRSVRDGTIVGVATPIHRGRTQQLWVIDLTRRSDGEQVARGQLRLQNINAEQVAAAEAAAPTGS